GTVDHRLAAAAAGEAHALAGAAGLEAVALQHDAGLDQLLVEAAHLLEQGVEAFRRPRIAGQDAGFGILRRLHHHHDAHRRSPGVGLGSDREDPGRPSWISRTAGAGIDIAGDAASLPDYGPASQAVSQAGPAAPLACPASARASAWASMRMSGTAVASHQ